MSALDHHRIDTRPSVMLVMLFLLYTWPLSRGESRAYPIKITSFVIFLVPLGTRQLKIPHVVFSSESADDALNQVEQKTSKRQWMLSGKPREVEPTAPKQRFSLTPVPLPKLGYIQITVTEVYAS